MLMVAHNVASEGASVLVPVSRGYRRPKKEQKQQSVEPDYLKMILTAPIYDLAKETPLQLAQNLSERLDNAIYLKREDLQPVFSFKIRGAYYKLQSLTAEERARGVVCCSAGNHAQGVAMAARKLGIKATIVMPLTAPAIKSQSVLRMGGNVVLHGHDLEESRSEVLRLQKEHGYVDVPPYDDPYIIAGQGTVAMEVLRQIPSGDLNAIFVCCGGGGLLAGIATYVKRLYPDVKVIGVEEFGQDSMRQALAAGHPVQLPEVDLFADGTAVRTVGCETFRLCNMHVDEMVLVSNDEICAAIKDVFEDTRSILEPSGALALAGCKRWIADNDAHHGKFVAITSGANMNFNRLRFVAERAEIGEETEALISVIVPEVPGAFLDFLNTLHPRHFTELSYRFNDISEAHIFASFHVSLSSTRSRNDEITSIITQLESKNMAAVDVTKNEFAKSHARYLVGGRSNVLNERVFCFEFREKPNCIRQLLSTFTMFNQTLFHYRNQGGNTGKVLIGLEVPAVQETLLQQQLISLGYSYVEETDNIVYKHFLRC